MSDPIEPLAGACLRPLGHLSVAPSNKANGLERKGKLAGFTLRSRDASLQVLAAENENKRGFCGGPRTLRVQDVHTTFPAHSRELALLTHPALS